MAQGLTSSLARFVAGARFEHLPPTTIAMTQRALMDAVGVTLAASAMGEGTSAFAAVAREADSRPEAVALGFGFQTSALSAALVNGAGAHALDFEDALDGAPVHPNAACVPVALALAQSRALDGKAVLTALAVGCDLVCRLGRALKINPDDAGWYPPPILSTFGAAATAASLLGLDADQTEAALALALNQATATAQFKTDPSSTLRGVRDAFPAHAGLMAALLAQKGVRGFAGTFEGKAGFFNLFAKGLYDPERLLDGLGHSFHGDHLSFKLWPSCRGTHPFIEAALKARAAGIRPEQVSAIRMIGGPVQRMLAEPVAQKQAPRTAIDAKFSLMFTTASALVHGAIDLDSFSAEQRADRAVLAMAAKASFAVDPAATMKEAAAGRLQLELISGEVFDCHVAFPLGAPANPVDEDQLVAKFRDCARRSRCPLDDQAIEGAIATFTDLSACPDLTAPLQALAGRAD